MTDDVVIRLPARVTFASAPELLTRTAPRIEAGARTLDLSDCAEFDSALVAVLLELGRRALAVGGPPCRVIAAPPNLLKLARLYGVDRILLDQRD